MRGDDAGRRRYAVRQEAGSIGAWGGFRLFNVIVEFGIAEASWAGLAQDVIA